jgi:hypothetical protein
MYDSDTSITTGIAAGARTLLAVHRVASSDSFGRSIKTNNKGEFSPYLAFYEAFRRLI